MLQRDRGQGIRGKYRKYSMREKMTANKREGERLSDPEWDKKCIWRERRQMMPKGKWWSITVKGKLLC